MTPIVRSLPSYGKDSQHALPIFRNFNFLGEDKLIFSMDITCLSTAIPNRHFKATRGFDIINDSEFSDANKVFHTKCVDLQQQGLAKVENKPPICKQDRKKLFRSTAF